MTSEDLQRYVEGWRRQDARLDAEERERAERTRPVAERIARHLVEAFGAQRVVLFGSLVEGGFRQDSDVDLAVEGLGDCWWEAWAAAERLAGGLRVDVVPLEAASGAVRAVAEQGEELARA